MVYVVRSKERLFKVAKVFKKSNVFALYFKNYKRSEKQFISLQKL